MSCLRAETTGASTHSANGGGVEAFKLCASSLQSLTVSRLPRSLPLVRNLTRAQCCNVSARTPDKCFWPGIDRPTGPCLPAPPCLTALPPVLGLDEPSETFMFRSHFSGLWR